MFEGRIPRENPAIFPEAKEGRSSLPYVKQNPRFKRNGGPVNIHSRICKYPTDPNR